MLAELLGTPAPIRTQYATRWVQEYFRTEIQCPKCHQWQRLTHDSFCYYCNIELVEQPATRPVVATPEQVQTLEQVSAGIEHCKQVCDAWDAACQDELVARIDTALAVVDAKLATTDNELANHVMGSLEYEWDPSKPLTAADVAMMSPEQLSAAIQAKNATEAEPGPIDAPTEAEMEAQALEAYKHTLEHPDVDSTRYFAIWAPSQTNDKKRYGLLCLRTTGLAADCSCNSRAKRLRFRGVACKHMMGHNAMITPAK